MAVVDSGWAWIICAVSFSVHMLIAGFSYSIGVYYVEFLDVFNETKGTTAMISALNMSFLCGMGKQHHTRSLSSVLHWHSGMRWLDCQMDFWVFEHKITQRDISAHTHNLYTTHKYIRFLSTVF